MKAIPWDQRHDIGTPKKIGLEKAGAVKMIAQQTTLKYSLLVAVALALATASPLALAEPGDRRFGNPREADRANASSRQEQAGQQSSRQPREIPAEYRREAESPRQQRLSPEERRQLRRDIQDAGREIYPQRR